MPLTDTLAYGAKAVESKADATTGCASAELLGILVEFTCTI